MLENRLPSSLLNPKDQLISYVPIRCTTLAANRYCMFMVVMDKNYELCNTSVLELKLLEKYLQISQ
jgi:hypothetical protein